VSKVQLVLITTPLEEAEVPALLARLRRASGSAGIVLLGPTPGPAPRNEFLTPRQRQVLAQMAVGTPMKEIAQNLGMSLKTAESHRQNLIARLGIRDLPGLLRYALRSGLVPASWLLKQARDAEPPGNRSPRKS
jgi:DNA-binding NarL/FixJ family response regulator